MAWAISILTGTKATRLLNFVINYKDMIHVFTISVCMYICVVSSAGIHDVHLWFLIFFMHAFGMLLGFVTEIVTSPNFLPQADGAVSSISRDFVGKTLYYLGGASIFTPWMVIFCYFFKAATKTGSTIPDFVWVAFLGTFVLFLTFGVNSYCCHVLRLYEFHTAEKIYIVLSFTAKTFLAADVFGGLNAQDDGDD
jgi:hypothetical protein